MNSDIAIMSKLSPDEISKICSLVYDIFERDDRKREEQIEQLIQRVFLQFNKDKVDDNFLASVAVFFNTAFTFLSSQKVTVKSDLYQFFNIINHLPILEHSRFYDQTMEILKPYFEKDADFIKLFDRLQLLYLYSEIAYEDAAQNLAEELFTQIDPNRLFFYVMYQLGRARILDVHGDIRSKIRLLLDMLIRVWNEAGSEATLFLMINWLFTLPWFKSSKYYKVLLTNLYEKLRGEECLNTARVGFELFCLDEKQVPPPIKMRYYQDLIEFHDTILNSSQLHSLHFFAGNYLSGFKEQFHESIHSFKASNYFLHECWERLIEISKYLRVHCDPKDYKRSMRYVEDNFLQLSNQTSLRNNSYVENLQMNFEKIEELYREVGELSLTDTLSGQRNRRFMNHNLMPILALAARHNDPVCFTILDIDDFKAVNDKYGHTTGDFVLKSLGEMLSQTFRHSDIIIRYGGDEFLILLFDTGPQDCGDIMERFRKKVESHAFKYKRKQIQITVSIGAHCENFLGKAKIKNLNDYINMADMALYEAKEAGRNKVIVRS